MILAEHLVEQARTETSSQQAQIMRKMCACGRSMGPTGECAECQRKRLAPQTKLRVNRRGDRYEQEADRIANQVMSMPASDSMTPLHTLSVQRSAAGEAGVEVDESQAVQPGNGRPLSAETRQFFESRFGHSFADVRIYSGDRGAQAARSLDARAFTLGNNIVFNQNQYAPDTADGRRLLAHELTHILQQQGPDGGLPDQTHANADVMPDHSISQPIIQRGPPDPVEEESKLSLETIRQARNSIDVTVYSGDPDDPARDTSRSIAEKRIEEAKTDLAFPISRIEDIHNSLQNFAWQNKLAPQSRIDKWESEGGFFLIPKNHPGFVRKLSVIGHGKAGKKGSEPFYAFGGVAYRTSELATLYQNGLDLSRYMVSGGTVVLDGCNAAAGEAGRQFMFQIGLIFFGPKKRGFVRANTGEAIGFAGEMLGGGAITLAWPRDFDQKIPCDPLESAPEGSVCVPKGGNFVLERAEA